MFKLSYPKEHKFFYATKESVGFDICSDETTRLLPGNWQIISTGLYIEEAKKHSAFIIPEIQIRCRSGLASKYGIVILGGISTIDADYKGEIKIPILNMGKNSFNVYKGDRIAQGICALVYQLECFEVIDRERGKGGFGSTD